MAFSVVTAGWASLAKPAFDELAPKRVFLQHLHQQGPDGGVQSSKLVVAAVDAVAVKRSLNLSAYTEVDSSHRDWQVVCTPDCCTVLCQDVVCWLLCIL